MKDEIVLNGIVLSSGLQGEYDRRLVILTREQGKITAFAKGVRRPSSQLISKTQLFVMGAFTVYPGRNAYTLINVDAKEYFHELTFDMNKYCYGSYFCEMMSYFTREGDRSADYLNLLFVSLNALKKGLLPVKFVGGMGTLGAGMVLGREGPMVQLGGNIGRMVLDVFRMRSPEARHTLLATGAASGLSAAFNAPLAGILFIIEEMRPQFRYNLISIKAVFTGVIMSSIVFRIFNGEAAIIEVGKLSNAPVNTLWLYLVLGMLFGCFGPLFNFLVLRTQDLFQRIHGGNIKKWVFIGGLIGGLCGLLGLMQPSAVGGGFNLIPIAAAGNFSVGLLLFIFIARVVTTLICFSSGAPGGIFAPMLALGTLLGTAFGMAAIPLFPAYHLDAGTFAIAGMGALLAASVRAPLTGIVLVLEMTDNYQLILPMIITCLGATLLAQFLGGKPLYSTILQRTLAKQEAEQAAKAQQAPRENT